MQGQKLDAGMQSQGQVIEFLKNMDPLNKRIIDLELEQQETRPTEDEAIQLSSNVASKQMTN